MNENSFKNLFAGFFVLFMLFVMIFIGFSLSGGFKQQPTTTYVANFKSISGLNDGSVVSYKGFKVGKVSKIEINPKNPKLVSVFMQINNDITIYQQTVATLQAVGITGQSQVELSLKIDKNDKALEPIKVISNSVPEIATMPSQFDSIMQNVNGISKSLNEMASKFNGMMSEENMGAFNNLIDSTNILLYNLSNSSIYFNKTLMDMNETMVDMQETIVRLNGVLQLLEYDPSIIVRGVKH
ncbi:MlaD family protein [Pseudofrancisella aestuarii]|uniref:MlaD family protein n=1 Tax=Pseudofrancisella aestuarii TaxID=2670347 RepID=A0ABV9T980_9GAMM|nr:MlaD family protein [Pseudofrancisella aestuarii]